MSFARRGSTRVPTAPLPACPALRATSDPSRGPRRSSAAAPAEPTTTASAGRRSAPNALLATQLRRWPSGRSGTGRRRPSRATPVPWVCTACYTSRGALRALQGSTVRSPVWRPSFAPGCALRDSSVRPGPRSAVRARLAGTLRERAQRCAPCAPLGGSARAAPLRRSAPARAQKGAGAKAVALRRSAVARASPVTGGIRAPPSIPAPATAPLAASDWVRRASAPSARRGSTRRPKPSQRAIRAASVARTLTRARPAEGPVPRALPARERQGALHGARGACPGSSPGRTNLPSASRARAGSGGDTATKSRRTARLALRGTTTLLWLL